MTDTRDESVEPRSKARTREFRIVTLVGVACVSVVLVLLFARWEAIARWYRFRMKFDSLGRNEQGYAEYRDKETGIVFVSLPGGRCQIGSREGEPGAWENERPRREVRLSTFLIAKVEVSQEAWKKVMGENPAKFRGEGFPVESVSWHDCTAFCERAGFALPTEAQWERACRAGTETPFAFGVVVDSDQVNFNGRRPHGDAPESEFRESPVRVDAMRPNGAGLYHMHGNVAEWCRDVFDEDFYQRPESMKRDPVSTGGSGHRAVRGGCWYSQAKHCRSASRSFEDPACRGRNIGFRPVWEQTPL